MYDIYLPKGQLLCPICQKNLNVWQGKDGPCGLFIWQQGIEFAIDQLGDKEYNIGIEQRNKLNLPKLFEIYSYDCPDHNPIYASCKFENNIWTSTIINPYNA